MIGAINPSSVFLAEKMTENIDFDSTKKIIEIGPGTGVFTRKILDKLAKDGTLIVFELNIDFYNKLKNEISDSRIIFINDSAENIDYHLKRLKISSIDAIVSSLPLSNIPQKTVLKILRECQKIMSEISVFIQFQYSLKQKRELEHVFKNVKISFTALNIPPAFIYTCKNK